MAQTRLISDDQVGEALDFLRDSAISLGQAKARTIKAEHMLRHTEALLFKAAEGSAELRKAIARTDPKYVSCMNEDAEAAAEFCKLLALREAAALRIEAWRSISANYRAMKI